MNNDGVINDEDRTVIGNPNPNWFFSLSNNFSYKGWELSVFLQGVSGNKIYNANNVDNEGMAAAYNQTTAVLNRWTGEGTSNSMPRAIWGDPNQNCRVSDRFVENGSYLRLKNITLSYTLPKKWMQRFNWKMPASLSLARMWQLLPDIPALTRKLILMASTAAVTRFHVPSVWA